MQHLDELNSETFIISKKLQAEALRTPILELASHGKYDEILLILGNSDIDVRPWLRLVYDDEIENKNCATTELALPQVSRRRSVRKMNNEYFVLNNFKGETLLHLIMKYRPPSEIIDLIIRRITNGSSGGQDLEDFGIIPELYVDMQGKTPLHIAAAVGCSVDVLVSLTRNDTKAAFMQDSLLRLPLHWACTNPRTLTNSMTRSCFTFGIRRKSIDQSFSSKKSTSPDSNNLLKVIQLLIHIYPDALHIRDKDGRSPIDIAKQYQVKVDIISFLQREARKLRADVNDFNKKSVRQDSLNTISTPETYISHEHSYSDLHNRIETQVTIGNNFSPRGKSTDVEVTPFTSNRRKTASALIQDNCSLPWLIIPCSPTTIDHNEEIEDDLSSIGTGGVSKYHQLAEPSSLSMDACNLEQVQL